MHLICAASSRSLRLKYYFYYTFYYLDHPELSLRKYSIKSLHFISVPVSFLKGIGTKYFRIKFWFWQSVIFFLFKMKKKSQIRKRKINCTDWNLACVCVCNVFYPISSSISFLIFVHLNELTSCSNYIILQRLLLSYL